MTITLEGRISLLKAKAIETERAHPDKREQITAQIESVFKAMAHASAEIDRISEEPTQ